MRRRGQYRPAFDLHEQVLAVRQRVLGDDHPDILASMNNLAETSRALGDLQGAHDLHEQPSQSVGGSSATITLIP